MARLIDADALSKKWQDMLDIKTGEKEEIAVYKIFEILIKRLSQEPTIDPVTAAGACYCRECKYYREFRTNRNKQLMRWCYRMGKHDMEYRVKPDDFCSWGQRREE